MIRVNLAQFNVDFSSEYLPYSVGLLTAYALQDDAIKSHFSFAPPLYKRNLDVSAVAEKLAASDIIGFSTYVWNTRYSLEVARRIKEINPGAVIIFGGPNVPDQAENFLRANPQVDFSIHGEGEIAFKEFLHSFLKGDYASCPSLRFIDRKTGAFVSNPKAPRLPDLSQIPSPYLSGVFSEIMKNPDQTWNVIWETNRGCPFSCTYCDWGSATQSKLNKFPLERLLEEAVWFKENKIEYIMVADANFGIIERDIEIATKLASLKAEAGYPKVLAATYTKNATERSYKIAKILMDAGLIRGYTVSTQSVDEQTLKNIRRENISQKTFTELQARFNQQGFPTYTDLIIGLPGETFESFKRGIDTVIDRGQYNKCYFLILSILPNAQMADPAYKALHGFETVWCPQKNLHEVVRKDDADITEMQELVIGTKAMPRKDWVRTVSFSYMVSFLYFNKLLHLPLTILHKVSGLRFTDLIEPFLAEAEKDENPLLKRIKSFFEAHAAQIQKGGTEYVADPKWLNIWWQPDKVAFMEVAMDLNGFYEECTKILRKTLQNNSLESLETLLLDAIKLNKEMVKAPKILPSGVVRTRSNVYDYYRSIIEQREIRLEEGNYNYFVDRSDASWGDINEWCKQVVWFGNKTSTYLYPCKLEEHGAQGLLAGGEKFNPTILKPYLYT